MPEKFNNKYATNEILSPAPEVFSGFCPITPVPKGRPRFARRGKFVQTFTPKETEQYENAVRTWMRSQYGDMRYPMDGAIKATYIFVMPRPKSKSKKKTLVSTKPDVDNLAKSFQDGLDFKKKSRGIALGVIANDSRVAVLMCSKRYVKDGEEPGTYFKLECIDDEINI